MIILAALIILIVMSILSSCKTRQVSKVVTHHEIDSSRVVHKDSLGSSHITKIDTSHSTLHLSTLRSDSSITTTDITPDSGSIISIAPDGTVTGKISSIKTTTHRHINQSVTGQADNKNGISETKDSSSHTSLSDSGQRKEVRDSTNRQVKSDSTVAANLPLKWIIPIIAVLAILGLLVWKFRKWFGL